MLAVNYTVTPQTLKTTTIGWNAVVKTCFNTRLSPEWFHRDPRRQGWKRGTVPNAALSPPAWSCSRMGSDGREGTVPNAALSPPAWSCSRMGSDGREGTVPNAALSPPAWSCSRMGSDGREGTVPNAALSPPAQFCSRIGSDGREPVQWGFNVGVKATWQCLWNHTVWRERRAKTDSYWCVSACQVCTLLLGQTGSH